MFFLIGVWIGFYYVFGFRFFLNIFLEVGLRHFTQFAQDEHAETCAIGSSVSTR